MSIWTNTLITGDLMQCLFSRSFGFGSQCLEFWFQLYHYYNIIVTSYIECFRYNKIQTQNILFTVLYYSLVHLHFMGIHLRPFSISHIVIHLFLCLLMSVIPEGPLYKVNLETYLACLYLFLCLPLATLCT